VKGKKKKKKKKKKKRKHYFPLLATPSVLSEVVAKTV
jgi:hypothetical protein